MTQYFITYNTAKHQYVVWNNQQALCRVSNINPSNKSWLKVVEFMQEEHKRNGLLEVYAIPSAGEDLENIMKMIEGIRKK